MANKVTVIGAGSVGATIAFMMAVKGIAAEIVVIDINEKKALGEAMDIRQGIPFCDPCKIYAGRYEDVKDSDIVVITSGIGRKPGQTRLELAQTNVNIMKSIAGEISKVAPDAVYVIVSNPVDVLTYVFNKVTDIPENRIIGTGTLLDTARLRSRIAEYMNVSQKNVHAYVLGEHGDSSFVPWSSARVCNVPLERFKDCVSDKGFVNADLNYEEIESYMRTSGGKIIQRKGATFYAIAMSVCHICQCIFDNANAIIAVSTMLHGEYGIEDCCLSIPTIVNASGAVGKVLPDMTEEEVEKLRHSAQMLKNVIDQINL
ncbi:MAG: L-lactate dehydrogenase [Candidatus Faecivicinus sp.]